MCAERISLKVEDIYSPTRAAKYLGVSKMTLYRWLGKKKISSIYLDHNYFHVTELDRVKALMNNPESEIEGNKNGETGASETPVSGGSQERTR
jgi:hypothetical protein